MITLTIQVKETVPPGQTKPRVFFAIATHADDATHDERDRASWLWKHVRDGIAAKIGEHGSGGIMSDTDGNDPELIRAMLTKLGFPPPETPR